MWLTGRLVPDHKTIADFRKDNGRSIGKVCARFVALCRELGAPHFLMKRLPKVATEMALHVLAYNLTRVINIIGVQPLLAAMRA
jgi:transposase